MRWLTILLEMVVNRAIFGMLMRTLVEVLFPIVCWHEFFGEVFSLQVICEQVTCFGTISLGCGRSFKGIEKSNQVNNLYVSISPGISINLYSSYLAKTFWTLPYDHRSLFVPLVLYSTGQ